MEHMIGKYSVEAVMEFFGSDAIFITATGKAYHTGYCRIFAVNDNVQITFVQNAKDQGLKPCGICKP